MTQAEEQAALHERCVAWNKKYNQKAVTDASQDLKQRVEDELTLEVGEVYETNEHDTVKVIYLLEGQPVVLSWIATAPEACWGKPHFIQKSHIIRRVSKSKQTPQELTEREAKLVEALKPFAAVGRLKSITRHPDSGLWSHQAGSQDEGHVYTRITSADCILAEATLTELGIANKGEV